MKRTSLTASVLALAALAGCSTNAEAPGPRSSGERPPAERPAEARPTAPAGADAQVAVPRAWMEAREVLSLLGRRTGLRYAVSARRLEGLVGPYLPGQKVSVAELLAATARAAGMELSRRGEFAVLQPPAPGERVPHLPALGASKAKFGAEAIAIGRNPRAVFALGESLRLEAIPQLAAAAGDRDERTRRAALLALDGFEGDFDQWPGRVSVFELPGAELDADTFLWVVEEAAAPGSQEWLAAVSVLARARESQLTRSIWEHPFAKTPGTTMAAIRAMGRCGDPDARATLDKRIRETFTNLPGDRFAAAEALAELELVDVLVRNAAEKQPALVRCAAAWGLGRCGESPAAIEALRGLLADRDGRVREVAALALAESERPAAIEVLGRLLLDAKAEVRLRCAAAVVIGRLPAEGLQEIGADRLVELGLKDADASVRAAVAEALGDLGGSFAVERLGALLAADADRWVRAAAARALGSLGPAPASGGEALAAVLIDATADVEVRTAAAIGLGQGRRPDSAAALAKVALDAGADWRLRKYAARSLVLLANRAGQPALRQLLEMKSGGISDIPLRYLDLGDPGRTFEYLAPWVTRGRGRDQQSCAAERIGELGWPAGVRLLAAGFNAFDNYTRCTQIFSLQAAEDPATRRTLVELLGSRRSGVRVNAALGLSGTGDPAAVDALTAALSDADAQVRMAAANSLGNCGDPAAAGALVRCMVEDGNLRVAHQALRALRQHGYAGLAEVRAAFDRVRGTERDCGAPGGAAALWDQEGNSWALRRHYRGYEDLEVPNLTYESTVCYEPTTRRVVQWGAHGRRADTPQTGLTWTLDTSTGAWTRPASREEPPGACLNRTLVADAARGLVFSAQGGAGGHGWIMGLRRSAAASTPWLFDAARNQWYPMRPIANPGPHGMTAAVYDARCDAVIVHGSQARVYDTHANEWTTVRTPEPRPRDHSQQPGAFDPVSGRFILLADGDARGRARTWALDLAAGRWTELKPGNPPPNVREPMVYDSANDVMLLFRPAGGRTAVHVYHLRENRWEERPAVHPSPSYGCFDATYDPVNNVTWLCGGWEWGQSGAVTTRETWTYRYRRTGEPGSAAGAPRDLRLELASAAGEAPARALSWKPPEAGAPAGGYHVYRGEGERPWTARWQRLTQAPIKDLQLADTEKGEPGQLHYYRVTAVGADGAEGVPSLLARTQPLPVRRTGAARDADGSVRLSWEPSATPGVVGYNVYRAAGPAPDLWQRGYAYGELRDFAKLNAAPVEGTAFTDPAGGGRPAPASESTWPEARVYIVRAVGADGVESGPGPATLGLPAAPGPVVTARLSDGRRLVISGESGPAVRGHQLYRADVYKGDLMFRSRGAPQPGTVFLDGESWPAGHRRQYFVIGVDGAGQLGVPSSPCWEELP